MGIKIAYNITIMYIEVMHSEYVISKISYRSIFKLLLVPSMFFALIMTIYSYQSNVYPEQYHLITQEIDPKHELIGNDSNKEITKMVSYSLVIGSLGLNAIGSFWVWLCLKIYFFFFRLKIKATLTPVEHDQKAVPADEPLLEPRKNQSD